MPLSSKPSQRCANVVAQHGIPDAPRRAARDQNHVHRVPANSNRLEGRAASAPHAVPFDRAPKALGWDDRDTAACAGGRRDDDRDVNAVGAASAPPHPREFRVAGQAVIGAQARTSARVRGACGPFYGARR